MGVSQQYVAQYERGTRIPKPETLKKFAAALGCTVFDLTGDGEEMNTSIGENIRAARKAAGLTQTELGERIGKTTSSIKKYELDLTAIPIPVLDRIAPVLGVTRHYLLEGVEVNEGYEIVEAEAYRTNDTGRVDRIVLGRMDTKYGVMWVTWESAAYPHEGGRLEYFWGHYHDDERKARADYHRRLIEKYE